MAMDCPTGDKGICSVPARAEVIQNGSLRRADGDLALEVEPAALANAMPLSSEELAALQEGAEIGRRLPANGTIVTCSCGHIWVAPQ